VHALVSGRDIHGPDRAGARKLPRLGRQLSPMAPVQTKFHRGGNPDGMDPRRKHPTSVHPDPAAPDPIPVSRDPDIGRSRRDAHRADCDYRRRRRRSADGDSQVYVGCGNQERCNQKRSRYNYPFDFHVNTLCSGRTRRAKATHARPRPITSCRKPFGGLEMPLTAAGHLRVGFLRRTRREPRERRAPNRFEQLLDVGVDP
jgi:hypothetical protein